MQIVLKDKTTFKCTDFNYQYTQGINKDMVTIYSIRFEVESNAQEIIRQIQSSFTKNNIANVTIKYCKDDIEQSLAYNFTSLHSINMNIRDGYGAIEIRLE